MGTEGWLRQRTQEWAQEMRSRRALRHRSELTDALAPLLSSDYATRIIEAAEKLGEARDMTAVPVLVRTLERCIDSQPPHWRPVATALVDALQKIGDRRALPLLYRLDNVRGIGLIPNLRQAIAAIEPQTSLLRPGEEHTPPETLLRPARDGAAREEAALLVRPKE